MHFFTGAASREAIIEISQLALCNSSIVLKGMTVSVTLEDDQQALQSERI